MRSRASRIEWVERVDNSAGVPQLEVSLREGAREPAAVLRVVWPDGRRSERQLAAASCSELTDALAFLIALTLDPQAAGAAATRERARPDSQAHDAGTVPKSPAARNGRKSPAARSGAPPPNHETHGAGTGTPRAGDEIAASGAAPARAEGLDVLAATPIARDQHVAASGAAVSAGRLRPDADIDASGAGRAQEPSVSQRGAAADGGGVAFGQIGAIEVGVLGAALAGVAPRVMLGVGLRGEVALRGVGWWAPALQLRALRAWLGDFAAPGGVADFRLDVVRLDACPIALGYGVLIARTCLSTALGRLRAQGSDSYSPRSRSRLWTDAGLTLALRVQLRVLQVHVNAGLMAPLRRDRFAFAPDEFHWVAALGFQLDFGVGVRFP